MCWMNNSSFHTKALTRRFIWRVHVPAVVYVHPYAKEWSIKEERSVTDQLQLDDR